MLVLQLSDYVCVLVTTVSPAEWFMDSRWPDGTIGGTYERQLANTIERYMLGGDAGSCYHYCSHLFYVASWLVSKLATGTLHCQQPRVILVTAGSTDITRTRILTNRRTTLMCDRSWKLTTHCDSVQCIVFTVRPPTDRLSTRFHSNQRQQRRFRRRSKLFLTRPVGR